jgi:hypothetical protein
MEIEMATQNATVSYDWVQLADAADDPVLIQVLEGELFEVATTASGDPTVRGHVVAKATGDYSNLLQAITRDLIGAGDIYGRRVDSRASGVLVVSGSSETLT